MSFFFGMPFPRVIATFTPLAFGESDEFGNREAFYNDDAAQEVDALISPIRTSDEFEDGRPHATAMRFKLYLPKSCTFDIRGASVKLTTGDAVIDDKTYRVVGAPASQLRDATPGDLSWVVEVVEHLG